VAITAPKKNKPNLDLLGFDLLFQLAHLSAAAAARAPRSKLISMAAQIPTTTAHYFEDIDQIATSMAYQYAEACRIVGEKAEEEEVRGFLLRLSSALNTGESESEFLAAEAAIQAEAYGDVYERKLEGLKKWTDAFTALIVSASLIVVVATVSTMIFDLGITFVAGLVGAMMGISALGVWVIYRASPRERRTMKDPEGLRSQAKVRKAFMYLFPGALAAISIGLLLSLSPGAVLVITGISLMPIGILARRLDSRINKYDEDISTYLRVLGVTMTAIGATPVVAIGRMEMRSMPSLVRLVRELRTRLQARVNPAMSWGRFVEETGSELVSRAMRVFLDGLNLGGDAETVGKRAALLSSKVNALRAKRRLVASSFTYLTIVMHMVISFLLVFIVEVVGGFNDLLASANVDVPGGPGAALGAVLAFNLTNLNFLNTAMVPVVIMLSVVNALAPKVAEGGYSYTFFYFFGINAAIAGGTLLVAPVLAGLIFNVGSASTL
jgi:flagellar protein FlaJ